MSISSTQSFRVRTAILISAGACIGLTQPALAQSAGGVTAEYNDYASNQVDGPAPTFDPGDTSTFDPSAGLPIFPPAPDNIANLVCTQQLDDFILTGEKNQIGSGIKKFI